MLEQSDLDLLTQELRPVQHKWESIGRQLFYSYNPDIHRQYSDDGDRLREMLRKQLQGLYTTWRNIVDSLRSPGVAESQLADQLEAKYCPSEFTTTIYYCTLVNTMQYNITLEVVACCVNVFSVKC